MRSSALLPSPLAIEADGAWSQLPALGKEWIFFLDQHKPLSLA